MTSAVLAGSSDRPAARAGLTVRARRVEGAPVVAVRIWIPCGARAETAPGHAMLTGRMLAEGTRSRDFKRIAEEAENLGMSLSSFGGFEVYGVTADALARDWERALEWAAELTLDSIFPADRSAFVARQIESDLESLGDQPDVRTAWGFLDQLYAPHPRARPVQGTVESLHAACPADALAHHARGLASGVLVGIAGAIDEDAVRQRAEELFSSLPATATPTPEPPAPAGTGERHREVLTSAEDQAHLYMGHLTVPRGHPDYEALELVAVVLGSGAGLTGRIPARIREREGLAYTAYAQTVAGSGFDLGRLVAYVGTSPETVAQAERGVTEEVARLVEGGVTEDELEEARAYLLGRDPFQRETARQWAELLTEAALYGLAVDDPAWRLERLRAVDRPAAEAAARRHLRPADLLVTVGLPE
ncbi:MAG TPA: pitrilysin family protein [Thermoanaerobaculia bacterium]|nr:pitrilysin family protein [Thermoanaerobaculia bacterium]